MEAAPTERRETSTVVDFLRSDFTEMIRAGVADRTDYACDC